MKHQRQFLLSLAFISFLSGSASAAILMVDFGTSTSLIETGFIRQSGTSDTFVVSGPASGSLTVTVAGATSRDRGAIADNGAFTYGDLLRDLFTELTRGATATTMSISGLDANTPYSLRVFALDKGFNNGAIHSFYDTTGTNSTLLGSITNSTSPTPTSNDDFSLLFEITSDASGVIEIGQTASAGNGTLNGFVLDAVPEPSTSLIAASALLFGLARRRR